MTLCDVKLSLDGDLIDSDGNTCRIGENLSNVYCYCGNEAVECSGRFAWYTPCEEHKHVPVEKFRYMKFLADNGLY